MNAQNVNPATSTAGSLSSTLQKPRKEAASRKSATFNIGALKKLNQDLLLKMERQKVQQELQSVKKGTQSILDDIPMMSFDEDPLAGGWKSIYLGLYSPFTNKYTSFMKQAIEKAKESTSPTKFSDGSRPGLGHSEQQQNNSATNIHNSRHKSSVNLITQVHSQGDDSRVKNDQPPSRANQENGYDNLSQSQWMEQQEMNYIQIFENISRHKRNLIESQIRNGNLNLMAQKYLSFIQQKKIKRSLRDVFRVHSYTGTNSHRRNSSQRFLFKNGNEDQNLQQLQEFNMNGKISRFRSQTAMAKIDCKLRISNFQSSLLMNKKEGRGFVNALSSKEEDVVVKRKEIIRRKSCECTICGGETRMVPIAAMYEEEEASDIEEEERETYSTGITLKFPVPSPQKPKAGSIFRSLIQAIAKSPSNRQQVLKNSKTQPNLNFESGFQSAQTFKQKREQIVDFFDKDKILRKYKGNKQFGGLSPIQDIERKVKRNIGQKKIMMLKDQKTQKSSASQINLFSPEGSTKIDKNHGNSQEKYHKLITIESAASKVNQSPIKSIDSDDDDDEYESPISFLKVAEKNLAKQITLKNNQKFLKFHTLGQSQSIQSMLQVPQPQKFFKVRNSSQEEIINTFSDGKIDNFKSQESSTTNILQTQISSQNIESIINLKSRNNTQHNGIESLTVNNQDFKKKSFVNRVTDSLAGNYQQPSFQYQGSKNAFATTFSNKNPQKVYKKLFPTHSDLKFTVLKKETDEIRHTKPILAYDHTEQTLKSNSLKQELDILNIQDKQGEIQNFKQINLPQIQLKISENKQMKGIKNISKIIDKRSQSQTQFKVKKDSSLKFRVKDAFVSTFDVQKKNEEKNLTSTNTLLKFPKSKAKLTKEIKDHIAYEKVYFQRLSKLVK